VTGRVLSVLVAALATLLATLAAPAHADAMRYEVRVDGLACPFCAYGLERKLRELPGVSTVEVELRTGTARFEVAEGRVVTPAAVRSAVGEAGFSVGEIRLRVSGELRREGDRWWLLVGDDLRIEVRGTTPTAPGRSTLFGVVRRQGDHEVLTASRQGR